MEYDQQISIINLVSELNSKLLLTELKSIAMENNLHDIVGGTGAREYANNLVQAAKKKGFAI